MIPAPGGLVSVARLESRRHGIRFPLSLVESYLRYTILVGNPSLENWHLAGCSPRRLALQCQSKNWLVACQYTVTGRKSKFELQLASQAGWPAQTIEQSPSLRYPVYVGGTLN